MIALAAPSLHLVTSRRRLAPDARTPREETTALEAQIAEAIAAGIDVVQVREGDLDAARLLEVVGRSVRRAEHGATRILVNERLDIAVAAAAAGVHLPGAGIPADAARRLGPAWTIGRSIHGDEVPGDAGACDYLLFGTVFPSASKGAGSPLAGLDGLRRAVGRASRPVVAIGGITPAHAAACLEAGAVGVAAIGAFLPAGQGGLGVEAAVRAFRGALAAG